MKGNNNSKSKKNGGGLPKKTELISNCHDVLKPSAYGDENIFQGEI